jgi:hypothetical protein
VGLWEARLRLPAKEELAGRQAALWACQLAWGMKCCPLCAQLHVSRSVFRARSTFGEREKKPLGVLMNALREAGAGFIDRFSAPKPHQLSRVTAEQRSSAHCCSVRLRPCFWVLCSGTCLNDAFLILGPIGLLGGAVLRVVGWLQPPRPLTHWSHRATA